MNVKTWAAAGVLSVAGVAQASVISYDANGDTLPSAAGFTRYDAEHPFSMILHNGFDASQSVSGGVYATGPTDQAKYTFWYSAGQVLDHTKTVEISARLKVDAQSSVNASDRAGLALGLTNDQNLYQEMYINAGEVFINKAGRVRDVAFALDAMQWHDYVLRVQGNTVTVDVDGVTRLTGSMFDPVGSAPTLANWAVVGDITSSASSSYEMTNFSVAVVPEPGMAIGLMAVTPLLVRRRRS